MPKYSWENVRRLVKAIAKDGIGMAGVVTIKPFHILTPTLWVDFLNADPRSGRSMYSVYKGLMGYVQEFRNWIVSEGYDYGPYIREMQLLSREDFLDKHPDMEKDAKAIHSTMIALLDSRRTDLIKAILAGDDSHEEVADVDISLLPFTLRIERVGSSQDDLTLDIHRANYIGFWLFVAFGAMVLAWKDDEIPARRCENCARFFIPYPRARNQRFHSSSCKSTYHSRERRLSNK